MLLHHIHALAYSYPCFLHAHETSEPLSMLLHAHEVSEPHITPFEAVSSKDKDVLRRSTLAAIVIAVVSLLLLESLQSLLEM